MILYGLSPDVMQALQQVLASQPAVERAIIYGSRTSDRYRPGSDIDLTLKGRDLKIEHLLQIKNQIEELDLVYEVDISIYHHLTSPALIAQIDQFGKSFYPLQLSQGLEPFNCLDNHGS